LACAYTLARQGHDVVVFDAKPKAGGLNEYGLASYKTPDDFAQREVAVAAGHWRHHHRSKDWKLDTAGAARRPAQRLRRAVFLGMGLSTTHATVACPATT